MKITAVHARAELKRRALPKNDPKYQNRGPAWQLSGADLLALAGVKAPPAKKAAHKAPKAPTPPAPRLSDGTLVSEAAWALRAEAFANGDKVTYADAKAMVVAADLKAQAGKARKALRSTRKAKA